MSSTGNAKWALSDAWGTSTGPRTREGLAHSRRARWKHGLYSAEAKEEHRFFRQLVQDAGILLRRFCD